MKIGNKKIEKGHKVFLILLAVWLILLILGKKYEGAYIRLCADSTWVILGYTMGFTVGRKEERKMFLIVLALTWFVVFFLSPLRTIIGY